ncbi:MAG: hypothetical protein WC154_00205 [Candidatus Izemoplasmatales bacterium]
MLNVEYLEMTSKEAKNLWFISTRNSWRHIECNPSGLNEKMPLEREIRKRIHNKYIKLICPEGSYLKIPNIKGERIQVLTSSDDNYLGKEFNVHHNKPNELYIKLNENICDMSMDGLLKKYIVYVMSNSNEKIEKYGLSIILEYKNNGLVGNPDFMISTTASIYKFDEKSILYNTIDVTFLALLIYQIVLWICNKEVDFSTFEYFEIALIISYFSQLIFRTKYVGSTILNKAWTFIKYIYRKVFTKKKVTLRKNYFTEREFMKEIYKNSR